MERPPSPDPRDDRIARATERLHAAAARVSEAQELLINAKERLAIARRALKEAQTRGGTDPGVDRDPLDTDSGR